MTPYYVDDSVSLFLGDCLEMDTWLAADVLVTDPPYGVSFTSGWDNRFRGIGIANDRDVSCRSSVLNRWGERPALVFGSWKQPHPPDTRTVLIWDKGTVGMGALDLPWFPCTEEIYVLGRGWQGTRSSAVMRVVSRNADHPTEKPIGLLHQLIAKCPPGTIADPFAGAGSTLVAAKQLGRKAIGVELEERYCEIAARRLAQDVLDFGTVDQP